MRGDRGRHGPADYDYSGAAFDFYEAASAEAVGRCTTDVEGWCDPGLPLGSCTARQTSATPGLVPAHEDVAFEVCFLLDVVEGICTDGADVPDASGLRHTVEVHVRDRATGAPLAGAGYRLTGPDYPRIELVDPEIFLPGLEEVAAEPTAADPDVVHVVGFGSATSGADGVVTVAGWFVDDDYTLTPTATPAGYGADVEATFTMDLRDPADGDDTWRVDRPLDRLATPAPTTAPSSAPTAAPRSPGRLPDGSDDANAAPPRLQTESSSSPARVRPDRLRRALRRGRRRPHRCPAPAAP